MRIRRYRYSSRAAFQRSNLTDVDWRTDNGMDEFLGYKDLSQIAGTNRHVVGKLLCKPRLFHDPSVRVEENIDARWMKRSD